MIYIRSILFNACFYTWTAGCSIAGAATFLLPFERRMGPARIWSKGVQILLRGVTGIRQELRGMEHLEGGGPLIIACKHQSAWETTIFQMLLDAPAIVLKRELLSVPFFGTYARLQKMIPVDRSAGPRALRSMLKAAREAIEYGRPIVIFPEGTRGSDSGERPYQAGIYGLYNHLGIPVVPVALNSGAFWLNDSFIRRPGTILMECLPPIEPGLDRKTFMARLSEQIETACDRLLALAESAPVNAGQANEDARGR